MSTVLRISFSGRARLRRRYLPCATVAALLTLAAPVSGAQQPKAGIKTAATWLDTITVVGTRTELTIQDNPASVSVIDQDQLKRQAPQSVAELLRDVPGVQVVDSSAAGMQRIRIRGESSRRVTILVDGQEITDHSTYGTPILVDSANIERIEVVRGPSSVLYGAKAIGGVVNIITKRGADRPVGMEAGGSYYSGSSGWQGWAAISGTIGQWDYRISGEANRHDDRKTPSGRYTSTGRLDGTANHGNNLYGHLGYTFGSKRNHYLALKAEQSRLETDSWTDFDALDDLIVDFRINLPKRDRRKVGLYYDGKDFGPIVRKLHIDAYYQTIDRIFSNEVRMQPIPLINVGVQSTSDDRIRNYGGTAQVDLALHPSHYTIAGLHYLMDDLDASKTSSTIATIGGMPMSEEHSQSHDRASIQTVSAFLQDTWSITPDLSLMAGLRHYRVRTRLKDTTEPARAGLDSRSRGHTVKSLGLTYTGLPATTLRALYSEGYITPTLLQLYTDTSAGRGVNTYGNPALRSETSRNIEIGARYHANGIVLDLAAFHTRSRDYITSVSCASIADCPAHASANEYVNANVDRARAHGVELVAQYHVPGTGLTPYASAAWIRRKLQFATLSTYDSGTPGVSGRLGLRYDGVLSGNDVWADVFVRGATGVKLGSPSGDAVKISELPGWGTLNLAVGGSWGKDDWLQTSLQFNNIFDKEYRASLEELPGTGRNVILTLRATF